MVCPSQSHETRSQFSRRDFLTTTSCAALGLYAVPLLSTLSSLSACEGKNTKEKNEQLAGSTTTGLIIDDRYLLHTMGKGHPESPARLKAIHQKLESSGLQDACRGILPSVNPISYIRTVHPESHINRIANQAPDESLCRLAVSGALAAVDAVCIGEVTNAFCAVRPPGHHASDKGEHGFCFYNNVAIAARYAQKKHKLTRILIVDWDYHHGNGTERAFYDDPTVLFFSTHAWYAFPGTGAPDKIGIGRGKGFNINVPLPPGADDTKIIRAFTDRLIPAANRFRPDLVLISAGFDSRKDDLLGDFAVTDQGFAELTKLVMSIAGIYSHSRIVSLLEGGYNTEGLALAVESHLKTLLGA
jgi:acetoin utilization deacetylase AcuC-like enzyme